MTVVGDALPRTASRRNERKGASPPVFARERMAQVAAMDRKEGQEETEKGRWCGLSWDSWLSWFMSWAGEAMPSGRWQALCWRYRSVTPSDTGQSQDSLAPVE